MSPPVKVDEERAGFMRWSPGVADHRYRQNRAIVGGELALIELDVRVPAHQFGTDFLNGAT